MTRTHVVIDYVAWMVSTCSVKGYFTASACGWPNSCSYYGSACVVTKTYDGQEGCTQGQPSCTKVNSTTNYPPATVSGSFTCVAPGNGGWCLGGGVLNLSASEQVSGKVITYIESGTGTLCDPPDAANVNCSWDQGGEGEYVIEFWAHTTFGDTSAKGSAVWKQDTIPPVSAFTSPEEGSTTPASGVAELSGTSSDGGSGLAGVEMWVEGGGWQPITLVDGVWSATWDTASVPDGTYYVQVRALDHAGNVGAPAQIYLQVTNLPPAVEQGPQATAEAHPQAVAEVRNGLGAVTASYAYDAGGNMTGRAEDGQDWTQVFDGENRLTQLTDNLSQETWSYTNDGNGSRIVETNPDGTKRLLLFGGLVEVSLTAGGSESGVRRYYAVGGTRLALRDDGGVHYLLTDHLGSVSAVLDGSGALEYEQRYMPFGQPRLDVNGNPTDIGYTGQRDLTSLGLMDYNARFLNAGLGQFTSVDSLIFDVFNPQSLNRYAYVQGNPLRYRDVTGAYICEGVDVCMPPTKEKKKQSTPKPEQANIGGMREDYTPLVSPWPSEGLTPDEAQEAFFEEFTDPLRGNWVYSKFGDYRDIDPNRLKPRWHVSIDSRNNYLDTRYMNEVGVHVFPMAYGVVVWAGGGINADLGLSVIVEHNVGGVLFYSVYSHLDATMVSAGVPVNAYSLIGEMGRTGTRDVHLHFEVRTQENLNLGSSNPFSGMDFWAFDTNWRERFLDLGRIYGYSDDKPPLP